MWDSVHHWNHYQDKLRQWRVYVSNTCLDDIVLSVEEMRESTLAEFKREVTNDGHPNLTLQHTTKEVFWIGDCHKNERLSTWQNSNSYLKVKIKFSRLIKTAFGSWVNFFDNNNVIKDYILGGWQLKWGVS